MEGAATFLQALTVVLGVAAVTTVLFQRLHQPVVLGYVLAGLIVGPHLALGLVADPAVVETLSELGVILLMFSLGLEFRFAKLAAVAPTAGLTALVETSLMTWLGFTAARLLGLGAVPGLFAGAMVAISSTTIVAKAFDERGIRGPLREHVVGVLIAEDLIAVLLVAALTAVATGAGLSAGALAATTARLVLFLVGLVVVGLLVVPRAIRAIVRLERPETTLVASIGICFALSLLAHAFGYSVAMGAFVAGSLVSESGEAKRIEPLVLPVRDVFAAIFFVSVGMQLDPALVARHWQAAVVLGLVVVIGKVIGVSVGSFLTGTGVPVAVQAGMSLAQIGEFSFIIAGVARALGEPGEVLYPLAVAISAATTLTTPWLIRAAAPAARAVDQALPAPLQTLASLYGSWLERLRGARHRQTHGARVRRLARALALDTAAVGIVLIAGALLHGWASGLVQRWLGVEARTARALVAGLDLALLAPFAFGLVRTAQRLGATLALAALPAARGGRADLAAAPRRALVVTLQIGVLAFAGLPLVAVTQPFLPGPQGALFLAALFLGFGIAFWRSAANLEGHVRAGAQVIADALVRSARAGTPAGDEHALDEVRTILPGLGEPVPHRLAAGSAAVGRTLAELNLRGATGATVLTVAHPDGTFVVPSAADVLREGDVLALAGSHEAVETARRLLDEGLRPRGP